MHSLSRILLNRNQVLVQPAYLVAIRHTSAGPPPSTPAKEGSLTYKYEKFIGKWPKVLELHRTVLEGSRWCFADVKMYFRTRKAVTTGQKKLSDLTVEELETLVQSGSELFKMLTLIVILQIPGPGDILILMFI
ncbi:hypothetical protein B9Z55_001584 [Caenorhabditis nigoni]|uniref:Uncharacterized protein n=1 Tax=Caenorhabditis nigoni TaxID=1611254 RepID=A0A2G5VGC6_9PELO|nr:hypothetical protein B9Z55_001584 [Caenorhabditis nigoni]